MSPLKSSLFGLGSVGSICLFAMSYMLVGWGADFANLLGGISVAIGAALYFLSLFIAIRSKIRALSATIICLGALLGILALLISTAQLVEPSYQRSHLYAALTISILLAETLAFLGIARASKSRHQ
jgi:hypothetical protein